MQVESVMIANHEKGTSWKSVVYTYIYDELFWSEIFFFNFENMNVMYSQVLMQLQLSCCRILVH